VIEKEKYHLHLVSDSTGETTQKVLAACLAQFEGIEVTQHLWPMVLDKTQLDEAARGVERNPGPVLFTLADEKMRTALVKRLSGTAMPMISVIDPVIDALGRYFHRRRSGRPGGQYKLNAEYFQRIAAMEFASAHDDGQATWNLNQADIVLVGVSRTSKTPTSMHLATHWGLKAANVPIVPSVPLPKPLIEIDGPFVIGLTAAPDRLIQVRRNRLLMLKEQEETDYVDEEVVKDELRFARRLFTERGWPVIDVTKRSIEETATAIYTLYSRQLEQRLIQVAEETPSPSSRSRAKKRSR
jgi:[pyruvate, water dikinase]-phosphate phosphotransferase / [pyruvate, water dikinase] kinase